MDVKLNAWRNTFSVTKTFSLFIAIVAIFIFTIEIFPEAILPEAPCTKFWCYYSQNIRSNGSCHSKYITLSWSIDEHCYGFNDFRKLYLLNSIKLYCEYEGLLLAEFNVLENVNVNVKCQCLMSKTIRANLRNNIQNKYDIDYCNK